jgi:hypothetical protein
MSCGKILNIQTAYSTDAHQNYLKSYNCLYSCIGYSCYIQNEVHICTITLNICDDLHIEFGTKYNSSITWLRIINGSTYITCYWNITLHIKNICGRVNFMLFIPYIFLHSIYLKNKKVLIKIQYKRSQNTLHIKCQLLYVLAPRCHHQGVYQKHRFLGTTSISGTIHPHFHHIS